MQILLVGFLSIVAQVVLLRELCAAFYGADLIYLLALGAWLLWTALGAVLGRGRRSRTGSPTAAGVGLLFVAVGVAVPLGVAFIRRLQLLSGEVPGAYLSLPVQICASAFTLLPASVLLGLLFQWTVKRSLATRATAVPTAAIAIGFRAASRDDADVRRLANDADRNPRGGHRSLAGAYAIESIGAVAGGLATTLALHAHLSSVALALLVAAVAFCAACATRVATRAAAVRVAGIAGLAFCAVGCWNAAALDRWMTSWNHPDVVDTFDSPYGRIVIGERAGQVTVHDNGALVLDSQGTEAEEFAHLSLLQHPAPARVLLLGGVVAGLLGDAAQHGAARVDDVELDARLVERLAPHLPALEAARSLPAVHLWFADPRRAIADGGTRYDVIVVAGVEPASAQANRLFTREFFAQCARRLRPGGVLSLRLPSVENGWTRPLVARTAAIWAALGTEFKDVVVLPGSANIVLASDAPLVRDPSVLARRLADRGIRGRLVNARYIRYVFSNDRYAEIERLLASATRRPNTDADPVSYRATTLFWLSKFVPSLAQHDLGWVPAACGWHTTRPWLLVGGLVVVALVWRWRRWPRAAIRVGLIACAGMMLESMLLVQYQLKQGVMFQNLGLLLMTVMAGLAMGAWVVGRDAQGGRSIEAGRPIPAERLGPAPFLVGFVLLALGASAGVGAGRLSTLAPIATALFGAGTAVGAVFAYATREHGRTGEAADEARLVSPLYGADVLGGCLGSLAATLLLIPLLGIPATAQWAAALGAIALLLA